MLLYEVVSQALVPNYKVSDSSQTASTYITFNIFHKHIHTWRNFKVHVVYALEWALLQNIGISSSTQNPSRGGYLIGCAQFFKCWNFSPTQNPSYGGTSEGYIPNLRSLRSKIHNLEASQYWRPKIWGCQIGSKSKFTSQPIVPYLLILKFWKKGPL